MNLVVWRVINSPWLVLKYPNKSDHMKKFKGIEVKLVNKNKHTEEQNQCAYSLYKKMFVARPTLFILWLSCKQRFIYKQLYIFAIYTSIVIYVRSFRDVSLRRCSVVGTDDSYHIGY